MDNEYFIFPSTTDLNRGDQALVWESINLIKEIDPNGIFYLLESGNSPEDIVRQTQQTVTRGYKVLPRILRHPGRINSGKNQRKDIKYQFSTYLKWGIRGFFDLLGSSLLLCRFHPINKLGLSLLKSAQKQTYFQIKNCKAVFVKGGGFIHVYGKIYDLYLLYFLLFNILLSLRFKKMVFILPNSIGPITGCLSRLFVKSVLKKCELISVRENVSLGFLKNTLNIQAKKYPDLGFFLQKNNFNGTGYLKNKKLPIGQKEIVGITLRPYRFPGSDNPGKKFKEYITEMAIFSNLVVESGQHILLYAHTLGPSAHEDDRIALTALLEKVKSETKKSISYIEDFNHNCQDLLAIYENCDYMIGTRFHSVIFAQNVNVPSIAIAYGGNKSYGIMKDMGLEKYVIPIENVQGQIVFELLKTLGENKLEYKAKLSTYKNSLISERDLLINEIKKSIHG